MPDYSQLKPWYSVARLLAKHTRARLDSQRSRNFVQWCWPEAGPGEGIRAPDTAAIAPTLRAARQVLWQIIDSVSQR
jgi:hypothetical protein